MIKPTVLILLVGLLASSCGQKDQGPKTMDDIAEDYVKLVLKIGQYDSDFVDAYYGPQEWKPEGSPEGGILVDTFVERTKSLAEALTDIDLSQLTSMEKRRHHMLSKQLISVETKVRMMGGESFEFDEEARLLYDAEPPTYDAPYFDNLLADLENEIPGIGSLQARYRDFEQQFVIPVDKLDTVFQTAIDEARRKTLEHMDLPAEETFQIEYVTGKSWSGYNYYKGNSFSLIQINTDLPIYIDRAIDLACHEGYPGHHVFNALLEKQLVNEKGWREYSVYPLFSPQSLIAEGSANYGIDVAFPGDQRWQYERDVLYPLAGIDPSLAEKYYRVQELRAKLDYAGNEAARGYLNGTLSAEDAAQWLEKYLLYAPERAQQRVRFFDQYRSYVINYNLGKDLVADYVERQGGTVDNPETRWEVFEGLLSAPYTASDLK